MKVEFQNRPVVTSWHLVPHQLHVKTNSNHEEAKLTDRITGSVLANLSAVAAEAEIDRVFIHHKITEDLKVSFTFQKYFGDNSLTDIFSPRQFPAFLLNS